MQTNESTWKHILNNLSMVFQVFQVLVSKQCSSQFPLQANQGKSTQGHSFSGILTVKACNDGFFLQKLFSWGKLLSLTVQMLLLSKICKLGCNIHISCVLFIFCIPIFPPTVVLVRVGKTLRRRNCVAEKAIYILDQTRDREKTG